MRNEFHGAELVRRAIRQATAVVAMIVACSALGGAQSVPTPDERVQHTLRLLGTGQRCRAHRSLGWVHSRFPRGVLPGDDAFVHRRYSEAFTAYRAVVPATRLDEPAENERLQRVAALGANAAYRAAAEASRHLEQSDDLTALITGGIFFAAGNSRQAEGTWISGVGVHSVPGGSSPYVGASLSILFVLDSTLLAHACAKS